MHYTGTTSNEILSYLHKLPSNSRIRIAMRVVSIEPMQNIVLSIGDQKIPYLDLTSMGLALQSGMKEGAVLWFAAIWSDKPSFLGMEQLSITAVLDPVADGSSLQFFFGDT